MAASRSSMASCIVNQCAVVHWSTHPSVTRVWLQVLRGHMSSVLQVTFIRSRAQLASFSKDKVLRIWDVQLQLCIQRVAGVFPKNADSRTISLTYTFCLRLVVVLIIIMCHYIAFESLSLYCVLFIFIWQRHTRKLMPVHNIRKIKQRVPAVSKKGQGWTRSALDGSLVIDLVINVTLQCGNAL